MAEPDRPQVTIYYDAYALHTRKLMLQTHTVYEYTYYFSTVTMITRKRLIVSLYVHCPSCQFLIAQDLVLKLRRKRPHQKSRRRYEHNIKEKQIGLRREEQ
jgi:hypothetical protein